MEILNRASETRFLQRYKKTARQPTEAPVPPHHIVKAKITQEFSSLKLARDAKKVKKKKRATGIFPQILPNRSF